MDYQNKYNQILWETFEFCSKFFKDNDIAFYGCGGTVLGAVRHKGLIPWDDDIDLYVPRKDYDKLAMMNSILIPLGYKFICLENDDRYYLPFGKVIKLNTSLVEDKTFPYVLGVYVDIFPLDEYSGSLEEITRAQLDYKKLYRKYQNTVRKLSLFDIRCRNEFRNYCEWLVNTLGHDNKYSKVLDAINKIRNHRGEYCVCTTQWVGRIFKKTWFDDTIEASFENSTIRIPREYDEYLKLLYGDYMTPPPIEKRISEHKHYYLNLKEGLTIDQVKERIKKGEHLVY